MRHGGDVGGVRGVGLDGEHVRPHWHSGDLHALVAGLRDIGQNIALFGPGIFR